MVINPAYLERVMGFGYVAVMVMEAVYCGERPVAALERITGIGGSQYEHLRRLRRLGFIRKGKRGEYVTPAGRRWLEELERLKRGLPPGTPISLDGQQSDEIDEL